MDGFLGGSLADVNPTAAESSPPMQGPAPQPLAAQGQAEMRKFQSVQYIAVDGPIGVGKTTLVTLLSEQLPGIALYEDAENPFLGDFYRDGVDAALLTELYFLVTRFRQLKRGPGGVAAGIPAISDYSFQRNQIFAGLTLKGTELALFNRLYLQLEPQTRRPDLLIYLEADTDTCLQRIHQRRRGYEETLTRDYLQKVVEAYRRYYREYTLSPILVIDTRNLNFATESDAFSQLKERLSNPWTGTATLTARAAAEATPGPAGARPTGTPCARGCR